MTSTPSTVNPRTVAAGAFLLGVGAAASLPGWERAMTAALGHSTSGVLLPLLLGAAGFTAALTRRGAGLAARPGRALIVLGAVTLAAGLAIPPLGSIAAWLGISLESPGLVAAVARAAATALVVGSTGYLAGAALRGLGAKLAPGPRTPGLALLGLAFGGTVVQWLLYSFTGDATPTLGTVLGALIALGTGAAVARLPAARLGAPVASPGGTSVWLGAFSVAFAAAAWAFLGRRVLTWAYGSHLPDVPVSVTVFVLAASLGVVMAVVAGAKLSPARATAALLSCIALGGGAMILVLGRYDGLPEQFAALAATDASLPDLLREAFSLAVARVAPAGLAVGLAAGFLAGAAATGGVPAWSLRAGTGAAVGLVAGAAVARLALPVWGIGGVLTLTSLLAVLPATAAVALSTMPGLPRLLFALVGAGLVAAAAVRAPDVDRDRLLLDRHLVSNTAAFADVQRHWKVMDRDGVLLSAAVLRRGHERRLLVNGRFELAPETAEKSHGLLAHLPLALHPSPERVIVLGVGTGWTLGSTLAHPVERVDLLESSPLLVEAARRFGTGSDRALDDERVRVHVGDPVELFSRAGRADVILSHASREWTTRTADVTTREFLRHARDTLTENGLYAQWIASESLTREGFLILLATFTDVFPRVELWAGQDGDVVVLAATDERPHDFDRLLEVYRRPTFQRAASASWLASPEVLLSQFLLGDDGVRKLAADRDPHSRRHPHLQREEAARRRSDPTVDPVPGLMALQGDVIAAFRNTPSEGFAAAMERVFRSRQLEMEARDLEAAHRDFDAVGAYREALDLNPNDGALRRGFAAHRSRMGIRHANNMKFTAAHAYLREAVEIDTTYAQGFANLGNLLIQSEDFDYAIATLGQATVLEPESDMFLAQLGRAWQSRGYHDKALPYFEQALQQNPRNVDAHLRYIDSRLTMQGANADLREGLEYLEGVASWTDDPEVLNRIGRLRDELRALDIAKRDRSSNESSPEGN